MEIHESNKRIKPQLLLGKIKNDLDNWINRTNLPILLTTVKAKLYWIIFLLITMIVLLYYAFRSLTPEYHETVIYMNKSQSLLFNDFRIYCNLDKGSMDYHFTPDDAFYSVRATNDSLIFNEGSSSKMPFSEYIIPNNVPAYSHPDSSFYTYGHLRLSIYNGHKFTLKVDNFNKIHQSECGVRRIYHEKDEPKFTYELEKYYYPNTGWCQYFETEHMVCISNELFTSSGNPYVLYQLTFERFEANDFSPDSDDFFIIMNYKSGSIVINNIYPEPSMVTSNAIIFKGRKKISEVINNNGIYFYLQNLEKIKWLSRFQNFASLLSGAILAWIVDLLINIIVIWKEIISSKKK